MERILWIKIAVILALAVGLLVPLKLIESKIGERQATRSEVVTELSNTSVGEQTLSGPLLVVPCTDHYVEDVVDTHGVRKPEKRRRDCTRAYVADELAVTGTLKSENRFRGIYSARFYVGAFEFQGRFDIPADVVPPNVTRERGAPFVAFSIRDVRGIRTAKAL